MQPADTKVPPSAAWLGGLGALPFIGLAGAMPFLAGGPRSLAADALVAYGATILSFLGGVHWGLAIAAPQVGAGRTRLPARLILSVIPSLAAWAALLVADTTGLFVLALAVAAMLWVDIRATRAGEAPPWYPTLRIPLTCIVVASLLLGASLSKRAFDRSHSIYDGVSSTKSALLSESILWSAAHHGDDVVSGQPGRRALAAVRTPGLEGWRAGPMTVEFR